MKKSLLFCALVCLFFPAFAADYYWVGGAGDWSDINHWSTTSGGAPNYNIIPNLNDDVYFDANSGLVDFADVNLPTSSPAYCRNLSWAGVTTKPDFVYRGQPLYVYGSVELSASVRYATQGIHFVGSDAATLKMNGAARYPVAGWYNPITINKPGSSLTLLDGIPGGLAVTHVTLTAGSLNMSGFTHSFETFAGTNNNVRSVDISNATLILSGTWDFRGTNNTINTTNSYIRATMFHSDRFTFPKVEVTAVSNNSMVINNTTFTELTFTSTTAAAGTSRIGSNNTIDRLEFKGGGVIRGGGNVIKDLYIAPSNPGFLFFDNNTITGSLHANTPDCDALSPLGGGSGQATITFGPGAVVDVRNVLMTNLIAAGSVTLPIPVTGADGGGNTGWDFQPRSTGTTLYWVGGAGDWNDKNHWSASSGGAGGYCVPFTGDNVVFDANSGFTAGNNTVTATTGTAWCHNMTWTNLTGSPVFDNRGQHLYIYGSLVLDPTLTMYGNLTFRGTEASTLTANGFNLGNPVFRFERTGTSGGVTLADNITHLGLRMFHSYGKLLLPNRTVHISQLSTDVSGVRTLDISNSTITLEYEWLSNSSNNTWVNNGAGSFIHAKARFITNGLTYPKVQYDGTGNNAAISNANITDLLFTNTDLTFGSIALINGNTIGTLELKGAAEIRGNNTITNLLLAPSRNYNFRNIQTINGIFRYNNPDCSGLGEMRGLGGIATLNFGPSSTKDIRNVLLENIAATGTGVPVAVTGADAGGNSGFNFTTSASGPRYWVGGSGDWNDAAHWSNTPGGPGGACVPTVANDVFFNASSFSSGSSTVTIDQGHAYCRNMDWTGAAFAPTFAKNGNFNLEIWGNLVMNPAVTMTTGFVLGGPTVLFTGAANSTITSNGAGLGNFDFSINKPDGSKVTFTDNFNNINTNIDVRSGGLDLSGRTVTMNYITDNGRTAPINLNITNATINGGWHAMGATTTVQAAGSTITGILFRANKGVYNKVDVTGADDGNPDISNTTIDKLLFSNASTASQAWIRGNNTINRLEFKGRGYIQATGNVIDTLIFAPGMIYTFAAGTNTTINEAWYGSGTPCNPTQIISSSTTANATVTKTTGTVDFDYIRLNRITAAGVTPFKAREHSIDLGGNVNWDILPYDNSATITGLGPDRTVCAEGFPVVLNTDGFFAGPSATYTWTGGSTNPTLSVTDGGTYSVTVQYPDGCSSSDNITITKSTVTVGPITGTTAICTGRTSALQSTTSGGTWSTSDAAVATVSATGLVTGVAPGTATITYTVTNADGCSASQTATVTVSAVPAVNDITGSTSVFQGSTTTLGNTTPGGVWSSANTTVATVSNTGVVSGIAPGTAEISYTVTSPQGCDSTRKVVVTVDGFTPDKRVVSIVKTADAQEPSANGSFSISLPAGVNAEEDITVTYTVGGTAGATDYTPLSGTVLIATGQNSVPLPVTVANDVLIESVETVEVTLGGATGTRYNYTLSTTNSNAIVDIADDDNVAANRELTIATSTSVTEGPFQALVRVRLSGTAKTSEAITISYTLSGTALNGIDYNTLSGSVVMPAGQDYVDFFVKPIDDNIIEGTENIIITITGGTTATLGNFTPSATQGSATLPFNDNDNTAAKRTLSVTAAGNAAEPSTHSSFTISLPTDVTVTEPVTVNYTIGGTAANGTDYTTITNTAVIPVGENGVTVPVTVINDGLVEGDETVTLTLGGSTSTSFSFPASTTAGNASVTIADDDNTAANRVLTITKTTDAAEPVTNGGFNISLPSGVVASENINVTYSIGAGTATPGTDYEAITGTITIPAGSSDVFVPVNVIDNSMIEPSETVIMNISGGSSTNFAYTVAPGGGSATVNIADNDQTANSHIVLLTKVSDAIEGGTNGQYRISLPPGVTSSEDVEITYSYGTSPSEIEAIDPEDFNLLGISSGKIVIPAGANEVLIDVVAIDDSKVEGPEIVILNLNTAASSSYPYTIDPSGNGATVNIIDANADESTRLEVIAGADAAEPGTHTSFTVKLEGLNTTSAWPVTVGYRLSGTAVSGLDYEAIGSIVIPPSTNAIPVNLNVLDDQIIEATETMTFTILSGSATDGGGNAYKFLPVPAKGEITVNIADEDATDAANRILSVAKTKDAAEPSTNGAYTVSLPAGYTSSKDIPLSYTMTGTATRNTDYSISIVTLPAYQNSVSLPVSVHNDLIIEGTETLVFNLAASTDGNGSSYNPASGANAVSMNLADDDVDPAKMVLSVTNDGNAAEPSTNGAFKISLPAGVTIAQDMTVNYTVGGTATAGSDYTALTGSVVITAGENSVPVPVTVGNDQLIENTETVNLTLTGGTAGSLNFTPAGGSNSATVNIEDDENTPANTEISIAAGTQMAEATSPAGSFTISLPGTVRTAEDITVEYTIGGTATGGADYTALSGTAVIAAGERNVVVNLSAINDQIIENTETVIITLTGASSNSFSWTISPTANEATLNIADDDNTPANLSLSVARVTDAIEPATGGMFHVSLPAGIRVSENVTVSYAIGGTATPGADYTALSGTVVIPAGENGANIPVPVINDQVIEPTETVTITLNGGSSTSFTLTGSGSAAVNITDDDSGVPANLTLTLSKTADAAEPGSNGAFSISLPNGITLAENVTVTYTITGTATAGRDYVPLTGTAVIPAGQPGVNIAVTVTDDQLIEQTESVTMTLTAASSTSFTLSASGSATANITDNESATIPQLTVSRTADGAEPGTNGGFRISLPAGVLSSEDITVNYTISGTATAGSDYTAITGAIIIPAELSGVTVPLTVSNDDLIEPVETVIMTIAGGTSTSFSFPGTGSATVSITDDESTIPANLTLSIANTGNAGEPGTDGSVTISLPAGVNTAEAITVNFTVGGTATAGTDYAALSGTAVIPAGERSVSIPVGVIDDQLIEGEENVTISFNGGTSSSFTFTGSGSATVVLADDDNLPEDLVLSVTKTADAAEPATNGAFSIALPEGLMALEDITVNYIITGTAIGGQDYEQLSGVAIIPAGDNGTDLLLTVTDDQLIEGTETVSVTITSGRSASFAFTGAGSASLEITDDDNTPENLALSVAKTADAAEPGTSGSFTISLPEGVKVAEDITVNYTVSGAAAAGVDYTALSGTVIIPADQGSVSLPVNVINDDILEAAEAVVVTLNSGSSASFTFTAEGNASLNIADDDNTNLVLQVAASIPAAAEPATNGEFTISLAGGKVTAEPVTVQYTISGTATPGTDYAAITGAVTIPAGASSVPVPVQVINDEDVEDPETVVLRITGGQSAAYTFTVGAAAEAQVTITSEDVHKGDLRITKQMVQPAVGPYRMGQDITYRVTVTNIGVGVSTAVVVTDSLPAQLGLPVRTVTDRGQAAVNTTDRLVNWTIGDLAAGATVQLEITGRLIEGGMMVTGAEALSGNTDVDPSNNRAVMTVPVEGSDLSFPNTFTPNGDGKNERFIIGGLEKYAGAKLQVFNRWGSQVYRSNDYRNDWNGSDLNEGTYFYILEVRKTDGTFKTHKGWVLIVR